MSKNQPTNLNFATSGRFKLNVRKLPSVSFFLTEVSLPSVEFEKVDVPSQFKSYPVIGDKLEYSNFNFTFNVDEDFQNYKEVFNWILDISNSEDFSRYPQESDGVDSIYSDASLIVYNSSFNALLSFSLRNIFPLSLELNQFTIQEQDTTILTATSTFAVESFYIDS